MVNIQFSKQFKYALLWSVLLTYAHSAEVIITRFYETAPNFFPFTHLFTSIPQAVYFVQHGIAWIFILFILLIVFDSRFILIGLYAFGISLIIETHHFFKMIMHWQYYPGAITSFLFIFTAYYFFRHISKIKLQE